MGLASDVKSLAGKSAVYGLGSILARSLSFLLLPVYTHYLTPTDYGTIAAAGTVTTVLGIVVPLGLHGAVAKLYYATADSEERRRANGTVWVTMVAAAFVVTRLLDLYGGGAFAALLPQVPFAPYVRLALWTAFFNVFNLIPLSLLQVEEKPQWYVLMTLGTALVTAASTVFAVVVLRRGAYGFMFATCAASAVVSVGYVAVTWPRVRVTVRRDVLRRALAFSLPLVPHGLASWVLDVSDRLLLQRYVTAAQIGIYALGFQFGTVMNVVATAINTAWVPFVYKRTGELGDGAKPALARLATVYVLVLAWAGLAIALFGVDVVRMFTAPAYHEAARIVPWVVGGYLFVGLYFIPGLFLFVAERTSAVPVVTVVAGCANVALNVWLMPRYGISAAAWTTLACYGVMALLAWAMARRVYPVPYEYARAARILLIALALFFAAHQPGLPDVPRLLVHAAAVVAYPVLVLFGGGLSLEERRRVAGWAKGLPLVGRVAR